MKKKILLGADIFDKSIQNNGYYVDKTELLYELIEETANEVTLFTRPRRFGKSLMLSMIESFFDIEHIGSNVFEGMDIIRKHPKFCKEWMHPYPVLLLSLKDAEARNSDLAYGKLKTIIGDLCKKHAFLQTEKKVDPDDAIKFGKLKAETAEEADVQNSLKTIMRMMNVVYGKPVILLIDEYNGPLAKAHANGYYHKMLDVTRGIMLGSNVKKDQVLPLPIGITPVKVCYRE